MQSKLWSCVQMTNFGTSSDTDCECTLKKKDGNVVNLSISCTQWNHYRKIERKKQQQKTPGLIEI